MSENQVSWHWAEGMKFAHEGMKLMFLLNGAAAISLLTFLGHTGEISQEMITPLVFFSVGAMSSTVTMASAYMAQLYYGRSHQYSVDTKDHTRARAVATRWHYVAYALFLAAGAFFSLGIYRAGNGLLQG